MSEKMKNNQQERKKSKKPMFIMLSFYAIFVICSLIFNFKPGTKIGDNFLLFAIDMFKLLPPAFVLVGLFMVWVDRQTIEKFFGESTGLMGHLAAIILACTTLYPFVVVIPMAAALSKKGARLSIVLTYLGASAICRIPMTIFEASFLGLKFSIIRYLVSLPLIVLSSIFMEKLVGKSYMEDSKLLDNLGK